MIRSYLRPVALTLAVAILLMLGATTGSAFAHEIQHAAHHTAGMHGTGICAWMCAMVGAVTTAAIHVPLVTPIEGKALPFVSSLWASDSFSQLQARAPPFASL
jgi:hypothetical protein